jgi:hypothetical protein
MSWKIGSLLDAIHPDYVETTGLVITAGFAMGVGGWERYAVLVCLSLYVAARLAPEFADILKPIKAFAKVPNWPEYVLVALAVILIGSRGGADAAGSLVGMAICGAGRLYPSLYP